MDFKQAQEFIVPFGKYEGRKIDDVASDNEGLRYLDWLYGEGVNHNSFAKALDAYLRDPSIKKELESLG